MISLVILRAFLLANLGVDALILALDSFCLGALIPGPAYSRLGPIRGFSYLSSIIFLR